MHNKTATLLSRLAFMSLITSPGVHATLVSGTFSGHVTAIDDYSNVIGNDISVSDIVTGAFLFDTSTVNNQSQASSIGSYWHYDPPGGFSVTINGLTFPATSSYPVIVNVANSNSDYLSFSQSPSASEFPAGYGGYDNGVSFILFDNTGTTFDNTSLPLSLSESGFSSMSGYITSSDDWSSAIGDYLSPPPPRYEIAFSIDTISATAVPLPPSILLMFNGLAIFLFSVIRYRRRS